MNRGQLLLDDRGRLFVYLSKGMWTGYYEVYSLAGNNHHQIHKDFLKPVKKCP
jgi:hypothetical protein